MKKIKIILTLLLLSNFLMAADRRTGYHVAISSLIGYTSETLIHHMNFSDTEKVIYASLPAITLGVVKEFTDEEGSKIDMIANTVGSILGAYVANRLNNEYFFKVEHKSKLKQTKLSMGYEF